MNDHDRFCLIPEVGLNVAPDGYITPCCIDINTRLGHITKDKLSDIFVGQQYTEFRESHRQGQLPNNCVNGCVKRNNNFVHINGRNKFVKHVEAKGAKQVGKEKFLYLEIGLGNVCNLTCTFCDETWSSSWAKLKNKDSSISYFDLEQTLSIARDLKNLKEISFKGGEPFNIPYLDQFLEELYVNNPDCMVTIVTNGTETTDRINNALFKFTTVIQVSTEATGPLYQYLRGGKYKWDDVVNNIKKFKDSAKSKDFHLGISSVILLYNYTTWADDMFAIQQELEKFIPTVPISLQLCVHPANQSLFLLNKSQRQRLVDSIYRNIDKGLHLEGDVENMIASILTDRVKPATKQQVIDGINYNNQMRNMDLFSIIDDFTPFIE